MLFLSPTAPYPPNSGSRIRIFQFLRYFSAHFCTTAVFLAGRDEIAAKTFAKASSYCDNLLPIPHNFAKGWAVARWMVSNSPYRHVKMRSPKAEAQVREELRNCDYDVVFVNCLDMLQCLPPRRFIRKDTLVVLDQHNSDELWFRSFAAHSSLPYRFYGRENLRRLQRLEDREYQKVDLCLSVSHEDAEVTVKSLATPPPILYAPNGVDLDFFQPVSCEPSGASILFCGSLDIQMNQDAIFYFVDRIFPLILSKTPETELLIVGRNPTRQIRRLDRLDNVSVVGEVDDVRPFYARSRVMIAPFRIGGGTKLKLLEAFAMKVPVVSTDLGCRGIDASDGIHLLVANTPEEFSRAVIRLLERSSSELTERAYSLVQNSYSWNSIVSKVVSALRLPPNLFDGQSSTGYRAS